VNSNESTPGPEPAVPGPREEAIFEAAAMLPADTREAYLEKVCGGDTPLRQRLENLLKAHDAAGTFLEPPTKFEAAKTIAIMLPPEEKPGDKIGRYKILQKIGEGGCGVVYMAEQEVPVRRRVALKVIKLGMDTKSVIARFEAERQALAMMDHPNIAKVLDAGATDTGRPFFVMELVRGIKITDYCDQNKLDTGERLRLFVQVCNAIQHAHQKGIIHRDIKPSNILVTLHDGVPVPKVIDFGIAKATQGRLTDQTLFTAFEQFIGTPAYMSPEQAEMSGLDVDTRSDIYALGVLLYELLTGRTPFDQHELLKAGLDEMRRTIREREPLRPSTQLSTMVDADLATVALRRHSDAPKLVHLLRGDLDWIVMKSLEKDRTRRYETANGMAMDIHRYLNNDAVLARPPSNLYRLQKLVRKNKLAVMAGTAVVLALAAGFVVSSILFLKEREARNRAIEAERIQASLRADAEQGRELAKKELEVSRLRAKYAEVARLLSNQEFESAQHLFSEIPPGPQSCPFYGAFGTLWSQFGKWDLALTNFARLVEYEPTNFLGYQGMADIYAARENWEAARANLTRAIELAPEEHDDYYWLGPLLVHTGDMEGYARLRRQVLAKFADTTNPNTAERTAKEFLFVPPPVADLATLSNLAETAIAVGETNRYWLHFEFVKGLAEYRLGHWPGAVSWMQDILKARQFTYAASVNAVLAMAQYRLNQTNEARATLARGEEIANKKWPQFGSHDLTIEWKDVIIGRVLLSEVRTLIKGNESKPQNNN
jgi:eukaryotic-like serine/threonine-protein kinase